MTEQPLKIGITCYPTYGGSGVIASEIGMAMARRGHRIHFICADVPRRLDRFMENIYFHEIELHDYPVFISPPYALSTASKMVEVATFEALDLLHVHYAVPHATSAYLAKQVLGERSPKIITTLHGTDITLVGTERSYLPITRFSIVQSDGVTAPSRYLKNATYDKLNVSTGVSVEVIGNFVNTEIFKPRDSSSGRKLPRCFCPAEEPVLTHVSNFRPVKRIDDVVRIFEQVNRQIPSRLMLVGDGPERSRIEHLVRDLQLGDRVSFLGKLETFVEILQNTDLFLLPSESESFGLAALEALSCGVPVIASEVGGLPEVVIHGRVGILSPVGAVDTMATAALELLRNRERYREMSAAAREYVLENFGQEKLVNQYEQYYLRILQRG